MFNILLMVIQAVMMLFMIRSLMQSSSIDYYHPMTQSVIKLTDPVLNLLPFKQKHIKNFFYAGAVVAVAISAIFWFGCYFVIGLPLNLCAILTALCVLKTFGYLVLFLLFAQALTSWLPSTRQLSYTLSALTYPLVSPVQKIIPPLGMIDLSLMIVMLAIFLINRVMYSIFGVLWGII